MAIRIDTPKDKKIRVVKSNMARFLLDNLYDGDTPVEWVKDILKGIIDYANEELKYWEEKSIDK